MSERMDAQKEWPSMHGIDSGMWQKVLKRVASVEAFMGSSGPVTCHSFLSSIFIQQRRQLKGKKKKINIQKKKMPAARYSSKVAGSESEKKK